jgi:hypothetical protein
VAGPGIVSGRLGDLTDLTDELDATMAHNYSLHGGEIAYEYGTSPAWIRYWDGATIHEITDNDYNDTQASLHGSLIAWVGRPPEIGLDQIFYVELAKRSP